MGLAGLEISAAASPDEIQDYVSKTLDADTAGGLELANAPANVITAAFRHLVDQPRPSYTQAQMDQAFALVRDRRFQTDVDGNTRRLSWLFPDDGCYTRAELAARLIVKELGLPAPAKIFSFGDKKSAGAPSVTTLGSTLTAFTKNTASGSISWWYHVAAVVDVDGVTYVFDAAIDPTGPMTKAAWLAAQTAKGGHVGAVIVCDTNAYAPGSPCVGGASQQQAANSWQFGTYLPEEWNRQIQLGRIAKDVLLKDQLVQP
jgi:hypothetical protein